MEISPYESWRMSVAVLTIRGTHLAVAAVGRLATAHISRLNATPLLMGVHYPRRPSSSGPPEELASRDQTIKIQNTLMPRDDLGERRRCGPFPCGWVASI